MENKEPAAPKEKGAKKLTEAKARKLLADTADQATADVCATAAEVVASLASYGIAVEITDANGGE